MQFRKCNSVNYRPRPRNYVLAVPLQGQYKEYKKYYKNMVLDPAEIYGLKVMKKWFGGSPEGMLQRWPPATPPKVGAAASGRRPHFGMSIC